jgi:ABC-type antimicrobial peptide transport system permease subunit
MKFNWFTYALQDLKRQKVKTGFAISGVAVTLILLTVIGSLSDSLSYSFLDQTTSQVGSADIIFTKNLQLDIGFDPFFDQNIIEEKLRPKIPEIDNYFPRILMLVQAEKYVTADEIIRKQIIFYGLNTTLEEKAGTIGTFWVLNENKERTQERFQGPIQEGSCIVTKAFARLFNLSVGDYINATYTSSFASLRVQAIVEADLKFTIAESTLLICELDDAQEFLKVPGKVNNVLTTLKNRELIYDTRDVKGTTRKLRLIGEAIQKEIGFDYMITLPKMQQLQGGDMMNQAMQLMFYFMTFFSMLITGILLNSILTTNIEERVREFGVLKVVGAKSNFTFNMVIVSGFIISIIGSTIGVSIGSILGPPILNWFLSTVDIFSVSIKFIILPETVISSFFLGVGITTAIALIPAFRAGRGAIANALDPTRAHTENEYKIKKEGSANLKLMFFGFGIAFIGIVVFILLPRIVVIGDSIYIVALIMAMLIAVLIGLVFACIGIVPLLQLIIAQFFKPFIKKYYPIYRISLTRYRRRNMGNIIMFAITFSFIFFISTFLVMRSNNIDTLLRFQYGADLVISNDGTLEANNSINFELYQELQELPRVKDVSAAFQNSFDVAKAISLFTRLTEEGFSFDESTFEGLFGTIPKKEIRAMDLGDFNDYWATVVSVDENYVNLADQGLMIWDKDSGSSIDSFKELFSTSNSCIIAKALADGLGITELGQYIRVAFYNEGDYYNGRVVLLKVVGISGGLPGFYNFRSASINLQAGMGIMLNMEDYCEYMDWGVAYAPDTIIDKIYINLVDNSLEYLTEMKAFIKDTFGAEYKFSIDEVVTTINYLRESDRTINNIMGVVLFVSILISLFGLISSMYSTLLERMYEIGIMRAMGLKQREVRSMLMCESLTVMLSAGSLGMLIGIFIAYLLVSIVSIITELPSILTINYSTLAWTFLTSIGVGIVGIWAITWRTRKWRVIDTLHFSF